MNRLFGDPSKSTTTMSTGKSTFINYLTNYFRGGSLQNIKVAIPSTFSSKLCSLYNIENNVRYGRLTLNLRNVIARLRGNLPDVVMDNVIVVLTNAKRHEANFNISSLQLHGTVYPYYMQNSAFSQDPNTWDQAALDALQFDWDASMDELKRMIETIDTFKIKSVTAFKDMNDDPAFEHALKQYKTDEVTYKDYTRERVVETKELVDAKYHSTVCRKCDHVCHDKCGLHETTTHGNRIFQRCWAMSAEGQCYICPSNCLYTEHYHDRRLIKSVPRALKFAISSVANKYNEARKDKVACETKCETVQETKRMIEQSLQDQFSKVREACLRVRSNCQGFNVAEELCFHIFLQKLLKLEKLADELQHDESLISVSDNHHQHYLFPCHLRLLLTKTIQNNNHKPSSKISQLQTISPSNDDLIQIDSSPTSSLILPQYFMASNPLMAAAHQIKETLSDAMNRLGVGGNHQNTTTTMSTGQSNENTNTLAIPSKFRSVITEQFAHCENNVRDTTQSKTDMCNQYIFVDTASPAQRQYLFLDTPGLSDTRGAEQDNVNMNKIIDGVESLGGLSAVIIVVNGTTGRLTLNLRNVIARLRGNLPDVVMDNVIVVLTNAKRHEANFNISSLQLHGTVYPYYMQNSAFSQDPNTWDQAALDALQFDWDASMDELKRMIETIDTFKIKSVTAFKDMKDIHYTRERVVETKELVDAKYHSTVCRKCDHVCHDKCGLHETTTHGNRIFQRCWAMSAEGQCYICPSNCLYTEHYHARKTMKVKQQKLQDVLHDIKAKYDLAARNTNDFQSRITTTQDAKKMLERALKQKLEEIKHKCAELRRICSGFNLAQELHALIDQLKAEATMLRNIEAKQQAEEFIRSLSEFCRQLEADQVAKQTLPPMRLVDTYTSKPLRSAATTTMNSSNVSSLISSVSTENTPNLNTSVLDLITKLNKPKKPLATTSEDDDDNEENSDNDDDDDDDDDNERSPRERPSASLRSNRNFHHSNSHDNHHDDEVSSIHDRRKRRQSTSNTAAATTTNNNNSLQQQYASLTTSDLVHRYNDCKDTRKSNAILIELNRRSQGKSTGPLVSSTDIGTFARYTQLYSSQDAPTLSHLYLQLQQRISNMTEPDILNIVRVPNDLLLEIAALYTLIAQKNQQQQQQHGQNRDGNVANESAFERPPDHIASAMMMKMSTPVSQTSTSYYLASPNQHPGGAMTVFKHFHHHQPPPPPPPSSSLSTQQQPSVPFTSFNGFHIDSSNSVNTTTPFQLASPAPPSPPAQPSSAYPLSSGTTMPISTTVPFDRSTTGSPFTFISPPSTSANESTFAIITPSVSNKDDYTMINIAPITNTITDDDTTNLNTLANASITRLLTLYNDAKSSNKNAQLFSIYQELERRCTGANCQQLTKDYAAVYETKFNEYAHKTVLELKEIYANIQQQIRIRTNNDATHINDIPKELIIESAALLATIKQKDI
ncbi:hypothetical protein I4U23_008923 [Adineta vaga]|nr:hypothetical protein I4U23_008923 [Adineta vaga]